MTRHNCPNCGAPIESAQCPYCGTVLYDFAVMDTDKPTYIRINWHGHQIVFKAIMRDAEVEFDTSPLYCDNSYHIFGRPNASATISFDIVPENGYFWKESAIDSANEVITLNSHQAI